MNTVIQDLRFSFRLMRKRPGTTLLVIVALVLGIGLNAAIFSVLNAVVLRPLPIFQPDRVVWLHSTVKQSGAPLGTSYPDYLDWKSQSHSFEGLTAMYALSFTLTGNGPAEHLKATGISASGFRVWGVSTVLGRDFTDDDDRSGANRVVILNYPFWQRKFGGNPDVLGKSLVLDNQQYTIIGVLQPTPLGALKYPDIYISNGPFINPHMMERDTRYFFPLARLKPHVSQAQAQAEMDTVAARLAAQYPATNKDLDVRIQSVVDQLTADGRKPLSLLALASTLIFVLAVVNVSTVFLADAVARGQELSVRLAVGATHSHLIQQFFIHAFIFAIIGGSLALLFAKLTLTFFLRHFPTAFLRFSETTIDFRVVLAIAAMIVLTSIIATLFPTAYARFIHPRNHLTGYWGASTLPKYRLVARSTLILCQVSLASALSLVSGLLIKSFYEVKKVDLGFNPSHVFSFQINLPATSYKSSSQKVALSRATLEKLAFLPGMELTSAISSLPLTTQAQANTLEVDAQSPLFGQKLLVEDEAVLPGFFQTFRIPLLQGRDFTDADHEGTTPVIIVDDVLAAKIWPGQNPLGKRILMSTREGETYRWFQVVGVVKEIKHFGPEKGTRWMQIYVPQYQDPAPVLSFVINTTLPEEAVKNSSKQALQQLDKDISLENFESMDAYLDTFLNGRKVSLLLLSSFAGTGIALACIGIYGMVANSVTQRRRELAIRMAIGATHSRVLLLITRLGLFATVSGIVVGSAIIIGFSRLLASFLFGITPLDPTIYLASGAIILLIAFIASVIPALTLLRFNIHDILRE